MSKKSLDKDQMKDEWFAKLWSQMNVTYPLQLIPIRFLRP